MEIIKTDYPAANYTAASGTAGVWHSLNTGEWKTKDSGVREKMETGSQRDSREGKGRFDLMSPFSLRRLAGVYERGAVKYDARNWEKGQPQMRYFDSAIRHLMNWYEGLEDEDHLAQAMWNVAAMVHQDELIRRGVQVYEGLDDRPLYWRAQRCTST